MGRWDREEIVVVVVLLVLTALVLAGLVFWLAPRMAFDA
jgi:hypothetical protein